MGDDGDTITNVWNIWWIQQSIFDLHQLPFQTAYLHYPHGVTLLGHTLSLANAVPGAILKQFLGIVPAFNLLVIASFIIGGLTAFWLCWRFSKSYVGSLLGGFIYTFSSYHFAQATGHLNLEAIQWIPLFLLAWISYLEKPSWPRGLGAAGALLLVFFTDYYFFLYCFLAGAILFGWQAARRRNIWWLWREGGWPSVAAFVLPVITVTLPLVLALQRLEQTGRLIGNHVPEEFSMDLLAPIIHGGWWRFSNLTKGFWSHLPVPIGEASVYLGISVLILLGLRIIWRKKLAGSPMAVWWIMFGFFYAVALGPVLHIWGQAYPLTVSGQSVMPYALLGKIIHPMQVSGVPTRMMLMAILSAAVLTAAVWPVLWRRRWGQIAATILAGVLIIDCLPQSMPATPLSTPGAVAAARDLPAGHGVLDLQNNFSYDLDTKSFSALYYQTIHEQPMAFGIIARTPHYTDEQDNRMRSLVENDRYRTLCEEYNIRYVLTKATVPIVGATLLYADDSSKLYDIGRNTNCTYKP